MARKKKRRTIRRARVARKSYKRRRRSSSAGTATKMLMYAVAYGAVRPYIGNAVSSGLNKVGVSGMLGGYADEAALIGLSYAGTKGKLPFIGKNKMVKEIAKAGLYIEGALLGSQVIGMVKGNGSTVTSSPTQTVF